MITETTPGVALPMAEQGNEQPGSETEEWVARLAASGPEQIEHRLEELERELEVGRAVEASAVVVLAGETGVATVAVCSPPGWRSSAEIHEERCVLKALRGDFRDVPPLTTPEERAEVARFEGEGGRVPDPEEDPLDLRDRAAIAEALQAARR